MAGFKGSISINASEQIEGNKFRTVNGIELSAEVRGVEYKAIDLKEYNNNKVLVNNSLSKNVTVKSFALSDQDIVVKFDFGGYLFGFDSEFNVSEAVRRVAE